MQPFIVIRNYTQDDELKCQELVRDYIMSFSNKSFFVYCFREVRLRDLSSYDQWIEFNWVSLAF